MEDTLLWSYDDLVPYLQHPDFVMRRWAAERLNDLYPDQAAEVLSSLLQDDDWVVRQKALQALKDSEEAERYIPRLMEALKAATDDRFGPLARTAGALGVREAVPLIRDRFEQADVPPVLNLALIQALEYLADVASARDVLWKAARGGRAYPSWVSNRAFKALMRHIRPEEIEILVDLYRARPYNQRILTSFAAPVDATQLVEAALSKASQNFVELKRELRWWFGWDTLPLSGTKTEALHFFFESEQRGGLALLHQEVQTLFEECEAAIDAWSAAWEKGEPLTGYHFTAAYITKLLEVLTAQPPARSERKRAEIALGLAMLCRLWHEEDDQADIENASDPMQTAIRILSTPREHVMPGLVDKVAGYGPRVLPMLTPLLGPEQYGWETLRALEVIHKLAHDYPGSCDDIAPLVINTMTEEQGDDVMEMCEKVLREIGVGALDAILAHLDDDDSSRVIYLTGVLEGIPVERAADPFVAMLENGAEINELQLGTITAIGSRRAVEPLYEWWQSDPEDALLVENLMVLCQLHDVHQSEIPHLRDMVEASERKLRKSMDELQSDPKFFTMFTGEPIDLEPTAPPPATESKPFVQDQPQVGRNDPCPCGSGKKYKHCCGRRS